MRRVCDINSLNPLTKKRISVIIYVIILDKGANFCALRAETDFSIAVWKNMDIKKAIKVVKEYGRILREKPIKNVQGRLISLLPYDKKTIKDAIKVELIYAGTAEPRDEKMIRTLKLAFLQLASFLPDGEVVPEFDVDDALASDDVCHNYYKYLDGSEKVSNHILEQTSVLVEELDEFCQDNGL